MANAEIIPSSKKIDKLLSNIEDGDVKIPPFQRGFAWEKEKIKSFLDSIYNNYPIGSILLWSSKENIKSPRNIGGFLLHERQPDFPVNYVLDGQQRLTTLYGVFCKDRRQDPQNKKNAPIELFNIYFDLTDGEFVHKDELDEDHSNLKMSTIFDSSKFLKEVNKFKGADKKKAERLHSQFWSYEIPIITTTKQEKEQVGRIFERINNRAEKLTLLDLMVAWTWSDDFHLQEEIRDIQETLASKGFEETDDKIILQCIAGIIEKTTKTRDIMKLKPDSVRQAMPKVKKSIEKAIDFLSTEFNITSNSYLPHSHQVVPLSFFFSVVKVPSREQSKVVRQWFWRTAFSKRYAGGTDQKMNDDIEFFEEVVKNDYKGIKKYDYEINENIITEQQLSKSNPYARAFLLLLAQKKPLNLVNGNFIDLGSALSGSNQKEYHHVFPRTFLKSKGIEREKINSICNYCFLPSASNKIISKKSPSDYMFNVVPQGSINKILKSNILPPTKTIYQTNNFKNFIKQRAKLIMKYYTELISD